MGEDLEESGAPDVEDGEWLGLFTCPLFGLGMGREAPHPNERKTRHSVELNHRLSKTCEIASWKKLE